MASKRSSFWHLCIFSTFLSRGCAFFVAASGRGRRWARVAPDPSAAKPDQRNKLIVWRAKLPTHARVAATSHTSDSRTDVLLHSAARHGAEGAPRRTHTTSYRQATDHARQPPAPPRGLPRCGEGLDTPPRGVWCRWRAAARPEDARASDPSERSERRLHDRVSSSPSYRPATRTAGGCASTRHERAQRAKSEGVTVTLL